MTVKAEPVAIYATPVHFQSTAMQGPPLEQLWLFLGLDISQGNQGGL